MQKLAVLASGGGSNLQALIEHFNTAGHATVRVALVISDRPGAGALERARRAEIETSVIPVSGRDADQVGSDMLAVLDAAQIDIVALAGYLKLVPGSVVRRYYGRIANIHPALLPAFGGKGMYGINVHRAVLNAGCFVTGVTVHHVVEEYDEGRPIAQWPVPVLRGDTPESLAGRVLAVEHAVYPAALEWLAQNTARRAVSGFVAKDPAVFGCTDGAGIDRTVRRLLMEMERRT